MRIGKARSTARMLSWGGLWSGAGRVVATSSAILSHLLLAKLITPEAFGAYFIAAGIVHVSSTFGLLGLDQTSVRLVAVSLTRENCARLALLIGRILTLAAVGGTVASIAFYLLRRPLLNEVFDSPSLLPISVAISAWVFTTVLQRTIGEVFRGLQDIRAATLFGTPRTGGMLHGLLFLCGLAVFWIWSIARLQTVVWLMSAIAGTIAASGLVALRSVLRTQKGPRASDLHSNSGSDAVSDMSSILHQSLPLMFSALMISVRTSGDVLVLGMLSTSYEVAKYGVAARVVALVVMPLMIANSVVAPLIARHHARKDNPLLESTVRLAASAAALPMLLVLAALVFLGPWILEHGFGEFYRNAYPILAVLMVGQLANALGGPGAVVLAMTGHQKSVFAATGLGAACLLVVGSLAAPQMGAVGVATAAAAGIIMQKTFLVLSVRRRLGIWCHVFLTLRSIRLALSRVASE